MIKTENLTKEFGSGSSYFRAVDSINIEVSRGQIHGFLGPNGAGKSTTIKMLVGAIWPSRGKAFIKGHSTGSVAARTVIGYSPERPSFYGGMTAMEYLVYMAQICGKQKQEARKKANELLEWLELKEAKNRPIVGYSAGMKQRLGLAQALVHDPELLVLDEPTANLDPIGRATLIDRIKELVEQRSLTIFVSSHILPEIEKMADYVTIIDHGKVILESDVKSIKKHFEGNHYVLVCSASKDIMALLKSKDYVTKIWPEEDRLNLLVSDEKRLMAELPVMMAKNKISLESFSRVKLSLEQIFMEVVDEEENKHKKEDNHQ